MKVLLIGPLPDPVTGNSIANSVVLKYLPRHSPNYQIDAINTSFPEFNEDIGVFSLKKMLFYLKNWLYIYKIISVDTIYMTPGQTLFGVLKGAPFVILGALMKKNIIVHIHGNHLKQEYDKLTGTKQQLFKKILSLSNKGIVLANSLKYNLTPFLSADKIFVVSNFVEDFLFEKNTSEYFESDRLKVLYLGNLMTQKGVFDLLKALYILSKKGVAFECTIAGNMDPSIRTEIESYFDKLGGKINYLGVVSGSIKREVLIKSNVFVLPSYNEGIPLSMLEAMASGNIIVSTRLPGIKDFFEDGINGFYVEKQNSESIADTLENISMNLEKLRVIADTNVKDAQEKFRVKRFIDNLVAVFDF